MEKEPKTDFAYVKGSAVWPPKIHEVLPTRACERGLLWGYGFCSCDQDQMTSSGWALLRFDGTLPEEEGEGGSLERGQGGGGAGAGEAEPWEMLPPAQDHPRPPGLEEAEKEPPQEASEGARPCLSASVNTLVSDSNPGG